MLKSTFFFTICATATAVTSANNIRAAATVIRWLHVAVVRPHNPADIITTAAAVVILCTQNARTNTAHHSSECKIGHDVMPDIDRVVPHVVAPDAAVRTGVR